MISAFSGWSENSVPFSAGEGRGKEGSSRSPPAASARVRPASPTSNFAAAFISTSVLRLDYSCRSFFVSDIEKEKKMTNAASATVCVIAENPSNGGLIA